jgi:hypothetical protein
MSDSSFDSTRDPTQPFPHERETEDERMLKGVQELETLKDSWRVFRIMGEFVEGFEEMGEIEHPFWFSVSREPIRKIRCIRRAWKRHGYWERRVSRSSPVVDPE